MIEIWDKYIFKQFLYIFCWLLLGFYGLYVLLDFSVHSSYFPSMMDGRWNAIFSFYLCEFANRIEAILPFTLLMTTIKILCDLNLHNEIVAMLASGFSLSRLLRPLYILGLFFVISVYINSQFLIPIAQKKIQFFTEERKQLKKNLTEKPFVQHLSLIDGSELLFQSYHSKDNYFFDVFWIKSTHEIYRIKYLYLQENPPHGIDIQLLSRNDRGQLTQNAYIESMYFPKIIFNKKKLFETTSNLETFSLSYLWNNLDTIVHSTDEKSAKLLTTFYYRIMVPWLCLLAILMPIPLCLHFTRHLKVFFIYALLAFSLLSIYIVMGALEILCKRQVLNPIWLIITPFGLILICISLYYATKYAFFKFGRERFRNEGSNFGIKDQTLLRR